jgi:outer membrane protein OmpA-like peptidoglycan-associated protein
MFNPAKPVQVYFLRNAVFFCIFFFLAISLVPAQETDKLRVKADKLFDNELYSKALVIYLKAEKKESFNESLYAQIARCHEQLEDYPSADNYYSQIFYKSKSVDPLIFLEYAKLLMKMDRNEDARSYFSSYNNLLEKNDLRAIRYVESIEDYERFFLDSAFIKLRPAEVNSEGNEQNPVTSSGVLYFASNKKFQSSTPSEFEILFADQSKLAEKSVKLKGQGIIKGRLEGFSIARATGELVFAIYDYETESSSLYRAFIENDGSELSKPEKISLGSFAQRIFSPAVNSDGSILLFASDAKGGIGSWDIYSSKRNSYGYDEPQLVEGFINTLGDEKYPFLINDTLLFFTSDGQGGLGGYDLFYVNLNTPTAIPVNPGYPVNSRFDEFGICLSDDGRSGYLASDRPGGDTGTDLYRFDLQKVRAWGEVTDVQTGQSLKNVAVDVTKEGESNSQFMLADNGYFFITGEPGESYTVSIWSEGYELQKFHIDTKDSKSTGLYELDLGKFAILPSATSVVPPDIFVIKNEIPGDLDMEPEFIPETAEDKSLTNVDILPEIAEHTELKTEPELLTETIEESEPEAIMGPSEETVAQQEIIPEVVQDRPETIYIAEPEVALKTNTEPEIITEVPEETNTETDYIEATYEDYITEPAKEVEPLNTAEIIKPEPVPVADPEVEINTVTETYPEIEQVPLPEPEKATSGPEYILQVYPMAETIFRLQIAASRVPLSHSELSTLYKGGREIFMFTEDNWYKYAIGEFGSFYEANQIRKTCGVKNAFIAAYRSDTKLKLMTAIQEVYAAQMADQSAQARSDKSEIVDRLLIYFPFDAYQPVKGETQKLEELLNTLKSDESLLAEIDGHADIRGSMTYNIGLSNERAAYVKGYFVTKGIPEKRISIRSYGENNVKVNCNQNCSPETHKENRRAEVILYR